MSLTFIAGVAQLVERFIRNEKVGGSIPFSPPYKSFIVLYPLP